MACVTCNGTGQVLAYRRVAEGTMQEHWERHGTGPCLACLPRVVAPEQPARVFHADGSFTDHPPLSQDESEYGVRMRELMAEVWPQPSSKAR